MYASSAPAAYEASWLPLDDAASSRPSSVTACTLPTTTSGAAPSLIWARMSPASEGSRRRSERNSPDSLMSSAIPDSRSVSPLAVKISLSLGRSSRTSALACATVSTRCARKFRSTKAAAARRNRSSPAGTAKAWSAVSV